MIPRLALLVVAVALVEPADRLPDPRPEPCIPFDPDPEEGVAIGTEGLSYGQVKEALNGVIQTALYCQRPAGFSEVHMTFELTVGCDGVISQLEVSDAGGAPESYVQCVANVVRKADFPAHDVADGMPVTYPVDVNW